MSEGLTVGASFGALTGANENRQRLLDIDLRVGDYDLDNTRPVRSSTSNRGMTGEELIPRAELVAVTDAAFKDIVGVSDASTLYSFTHNASGGLLPSSILGIQAPQTGRRDLQAVSVGIPEVERPSPLPTPLDLVLDLDTMVLEVHPPTVDLILAYAERQMTGTVGAVGAEAPRDQAGVSGRLGVEQEDHLIPATEEDVPPFQSRMEGEAEHSAVELLGGRQVVHVQAGFEDAVEFSWPVSLGSFCRRAMHLGCSPELKPSPPGHQAGLVPSPVAGMPLALSAASSLRSRAACPARRARNRAASPNRPRRRW